MSLYCDLLLIAANIVAWYYTLLGTSGTLWLHCTWEMVQINLCLKLSHFEYPQWHNFQDCMTYVVTVCTLIFLNYLTFILTFAETK